jgi:hypothetical protein
LWRDNFEAQISFDIVKSAQRDLILRWATSTRWLYAGGMEKMQITVLSLREEQGQVVAGARAAARDATVHLQGWFDRPTGAVRQELWQEARDQVLRYLDPT